MYIDRERDILLLFSWATLLNLVYIERDIERDILLLFNRSRAFRRARVLGVMVWGVIGSWGRTARGLIGQDEGGPSKNHPKLVQNWSKIGPKSVKNREKCDLERFRCQVAARSALGRVARRFLLHGGRLFGRKWAATGRFWDPPEIRNGSKIALFSIDRRFLLQKCSPGAVPKKHGKLDGKLIGKSMISERPGG